MKEKHTYHRNDASGVLPEGLRANPYTVPDGYFDNLFQLTVQHCQKGDGTSGAWSVPAGYFEQLADSITIKIAEQELRAIANEPGFIVPDGYFDELEQQSIAEGKLSGFVADTGFTVPQYYFDELSARIRERAEQPATPIRRLGWPKWVTYAAASIALVLGLAGVFNVVNDTSEAHTSLASVPDQQILDYLELYGSPDDMLYISEQIDDFDEQSIGVGISDEDIEAYLNHTL